MAFRGCNVCYLNAIALNRPYLLDHLRPRSKIKGNILILVSGLHNNENLITLKKRKEWENSHMLFAHALKSLDHSIVQIKMKKVETPVMMVFIFLSTQESI